MKQVTAHGVVLAVALIAAWFAWTSNESAADTSEATITVWDHDPRDIAAVQFASDERAVRIERRQTEDRSYLWARQTTYPPAPPQPPAPDTAAEPVAVADTSMVSTAENADDADPVEAGETDVADATAAEDTAPADPPEQVAEFPVGDEGDSLIEDLARLRAVRDLGEADEDARAAYGFADSAATVTVQLRGGEERTLMLGNTAIGGTDRYVLDIERSRIFALPATVIQPLETGQMLRLTEYQTFDSDDVARVTVRAGAGERTMERHASGTSGPETWSPPNSDQQDPAFAGFMDQVNRLWVSEFVPEVSADTLESMVRIDYYDRRDNAIGYLELFRAPGGADAPDSTRYFMRSPRTVVLGEVYGPLGERLEQDLETMFGGEPAAASASAAATRPRTLGS